MPFIWPIPGSTPVTDPSVEELRRQADAHLKNATELAGRPCAKEELLYMWDNQIAALDNFLANTEGLIEDGLLKLRDQLRDVKKQLTDAVIAFEAKAAGEEIPDDPEPEELVAGYMEMAGEMTSLVAEALEERVEDVKDLVKWENPLEVINSYLADSEPYESASKDLRKMRNIVRAAKADLEGRIKDVFEDWRRHDMSSRD